MPTSCPGCWSCITSRACSTPPRPRTGCEARSCSSRWRIRSASRKDCCTPASVASRPRRERTSTAAIRTTGRRSRRHVEATLGADPVANRATIRAAMRAHIDAVVPATELASLRKTLSTLACDADVVLDLHCDLEAVLHLYCEAPYWPQCEPLARLLGVEATLLAKNSGGASFDEHLSGPWWQLDERLERTRRRRPPGDPDGLHGGDGRAARPGGRGPCARRARRPRAVRLPRASRPDRRRGRAAVVARRCATPPRRCRGSEDLRAPHAGVVAFLKAPGERIAAGEAIAEVVDPVSGIATPVCARFGGLLYARALRRYAGPGDSIAHVAGTVPFRTGNLLSP